MSVIIRLQNLPWSANALDIRRFFNGLAIPDGGVHIVGGEKGDAFIAFSTDEDARRAMLMDNGRLAANTIKLLLSSKTEMQNVIAVARGSTPTSSASGPQPPNPAQPSSAYSAPHPQQGGPPPMNQPRFGPPTAQPNYPQNQAPPYNPQVGGPPPQGPNLSGPMPPQDQRQMAAPPYGHPQPQGIPQPLPPHGRSVWEGQPPPVQTGMQPGMEWRRDLPSQGDMPHPNDGMMNQGFDRGMPPRDGGQNAPYSNSGPMNGSHHMMDRPPQQGPPPPDYRENRRDYRDEYVYREHSPRRDYDSRDFGRRDDRKRGYEQRSPFIFISRMPENCSYKDVRKFFTGLEIPRDGLKLINDRKGRRVGDAFVKFSSPDIANEALRHDGWRMDGFAVRVEKASPEEFDRAIDSYTPGRSPNRERAMHYDNPGDHNMPYDNHGPGYERGAPPQMGYHQGGPFQHDQPPPFKRRRSLSPSQVRKGNSLCVVVKNLPFQVEKRDLFKFFSGLRFQKGDASVVLEEGPNGKLKGTALIEFQSERDVLRALSYHRKESLGGRLLDIISIPDDEYNSRVARCLKLPPNELIASEKHMERSLSKKKEEQIEKSILKDEGKSIPAKDLMEKKSEDKNKMDIKTDNKRYYCVELRGCPFSTNKKTILEFFSGLEIANRGIQIIFKPDGSAAGPAFVEFVSSDDCKKALEKDKHYIGKRYIDVNPISKKDMVIEMEALQAKFGAHRRGGGPSVAQKVGKTGCVVAVQNLHYSATLEDIMVFFRGFHPIADSVKMRYNQDGRPTGDAMIAFHTREDADRASKQLDKMKMHNRTISVYVV